VPWGWYARGKAARLANEAQTAPAQNSQPATQPLAANETSDAPAASDSVTTSTSAEAADLAAKRAREARLKESNGEDAGGLNGSRPGTTTARRSQPERSQGPSHYRRPDRKKATVQVTFDENGRVTQASGGDATALRIARLETLSCREGWFGHSHDSD